MATAQGPQEVSRRELVKHLRDWLSSRTPLWAHFQPLAPSFPFRLVFATRGALAMVAACAYLLNPNVTIRGGVLLPVAAVIVVQSSLGASLLTAWRVIIAGLVAAAYSTAVVSIFSPSFAIALGLLAVFVFVVSFLDTTQAFARFALGTSVVVLLQWQDPLIAAVDVSFVWDVVRAICIGAAVGVGAGCIPLPAVATAAREAGGRIRFLGAVLRQQLAALAIAFTHVTPHEEAPAATTIRSAFIREIEQVDLETELLAAAGAGAGGGEGVGSRGGGGGYDTAPLAAAAVPAASASTASAAALRVGIADLDGFGERAPLLRADIEDLHDTAGGLLAPLPGAIAMVDIEPLGWPLLAERLLWLAWRTTAHICGLALGATLLFTLAIARGLRASRLALRIEAALASVHRLLAHGPPLFRRDPATRKHSRASVIFRTKAWAAALSSLHRIVRAQMVAEQAVTTSRMHTAFVSHVSGPLCTLVYRTAVYMSLGIAFSARYRLDTSRLGAFLRLCCCCGKRGGSGGASGVCNLVVPPYGYPGELVPLLGDLTAARNELEAALTRFYGAYRRARSQVVYAETQAGSSTSSAGGAAALPAILRLPSGRHLGASPGGGAGLAAGLGATAAVATDGPSGAQQPPLLPPPPPALAAGAGMPRGSSLEQPSARARAPTALGSSYAAVPITVDAFDWQISHLISINAFLFTVLRAVQVVLATVDAVMTVPAEAPSGSGGSDSSSSLPATQPQAPSPQPPVASVAIDVATSSSGIPSDSGAGGVGAGGAAAPAPLPPKPAPATPIALDGTVSPTAADADAAATAALPLPLPLEVGDVPSPVALPHAPPPPSPAPATSAPSHSLRYHAAALAHAASSWAPGAAGWVMQRIGLQWTLGNLKRAIRITVGVVVAALVSYYLRDATSAPFVFWAPVTVAFMTGGTEFSTWRNGTMRLLGTLVGAAFGFFIIRVAGRSDVGTAALLTLWVAAMQYLRAEVRTSYLAIVAAFTAVIVAIGSAGTATAASSLALIRIEQTVVGIVVWLVVSTFVFPVSARGVAKAKTVAALRAVAAAVRGTTQELHTFVDQESAVVRAFDAFKLAQKTARGSPAAASPSPLPPPPFISDAALRRVDPTAPLQGVDAILAALPELLNDAEVEPALWRSPFQALRPRYEEMACGMRRAVRATRLIHQCLVALRAQARVHSDRRALTYQAYLAAQKTQAAQAAARAAAAGGGEQLGASLSRSPSMEGLVSRLAGLLPSPSSSGDLYTMTLVLPKDWRGHSRGQHLGPARGEGGGGAAPPGLADANGSVHHAPPPRRPPLPFGLRPPPAPETNTEHSGFRRSLSTVLTPRGAGDASSSGSTPIAAPVVVSGGALPSHPSDPNLSSLLANPLINRSTPTTPQPGATVLLATTAAPAPGSGLPVPSSLPPTHEHDSTSRFDANPSSTRGVLAFHPNLANIEEIAAAACDMLALCVAIFEGGMTEEGAAAGASAAVASHTSVWQRLACRFGLQKPAAQTPSSSSSSSSSLPSSATAPADHTNEAELPAPGPHYAARTIGMRELAATSPSSGTHHSGPRARTESTFQPGTGDSHGASMRGLLDPMVRLPAAVDRLLAGLYTFTQEYNVFVHTHTAAVVRKYAAQTASVPSAAAPSPNDAPLGLELETEGPSPTPVIAGAALPASLPQQPLPASADKRLLLSNLDALSFNTCAFALTELTDALCDLARTSRRFHHVTTRNALVQT